MKSLKLYSLLKLAVIAGNVMFILWITFNAIDEGFRATLIEKLSALGLLGLLTINSFLLVKENNGQTVNEFGVKLQLPIDQYRKISRTTKYSTLIILLTFVSLFLTELIKRECVHLFNYALIGAAMIVYYTLLLSFSEQIGFNYAYLLSSVSTILLIAIFTASLLKNRGVAILFTLILSLFYGFIFIIIQLEQLSLLFGSVALFLVVATLMYFSRKISWDKQ